MAVQTEQDRIRSLIKNSLMLLCKNTLSNKASVRVEGLIGITVNEKDVFLVNINETVSTDVRTDKISPIRGQKKATRMARKRPREKGQTMEGNIKYGCSPEKKTADTTNVVEFGGYKVLIKDESMCNSENEDSEANDEEDYSNFEGDTDDNTGPNVAASQATLSAASQVICVKQHSNNKQPKDEEDYSNSGGNTHDNTGPDVTASQANFMAAWQPVCRNLTTRRILRICDIMSLLTRLTPANSVGPTNVSTPDVTALSVTFNFNVSMRIRDKTPSGQVIVTTEAVQKPPKYKNRKGMTYNTYTPEKRVQIARYALDHSNTQAARHFNISESTVRSFKKAFLEIAAEVPSDQITEIYDMPRGRPPKEEQQDNFEDIGLL